MARFVGIPSTNKDQNDRAFVWQRPVGPRDPQDMVDVTEWVRVLDARLPAQHRECLTRDRHKGAEAALVGSDGEQALLHDGVGNVMVIPAPLVIDAEYGTPPY